MTTHSFTLRLDDRRFELLGRIAAERGISKADVLRLALDREAAAVVRDREFDQLLDDVMLENREALDLLA